MDIHRIKDRLEEWWRYPQPTRMQQQVLAQYTDVRDVAEIARQRAGETSADYMMSSELHKAHNFAVDYDLHTWVCEQTDRDLLANGGLVMEMGVATGRTVNHIARELPNTTVFGFDSFEGLNETWNWYIREGHFAQPVPRVRKNVDLRVGWFEDTLGPFLAEYHQPIALLHIDSDLYSSARYVLDRTVHRLVPNSIVLFDEYFNYPGWEQHEFRAWQETVKRHKIKYEYIGMVTRHQKVAVRIK